MFLAPLTSLSLSIIKLHLVQLKTSLDPTLFKEPHLPQVLDVYSYVHMSSVQFLRSHFSFNIG